MTTYLLAWSSKRWDWENLTNIALDAKYGRQIPEQQWSCGNNKTIQEGDRIFLIRLGDEPRGIFASGVVVRGSYESKHWNKELAKAGKKTFFVDIQFDSLLDPDKDRILPRKLLETQPFSKMHWDIQMSGVRIHDDVAEELESLWEYFAYDKFDKLSVQKYINALREIKLDKNDLAALKAHFEAPDYDITATQLARRIGFPDHRIANLTYGVLSKKILKLFNIRVKDSDNLIALVKTYFHHQTEEWHWVLRPQVADALKNLEWVKGNQPPTALEDLKQRKASYLPLEKTEREAIIQSRIGQGKFRKYLINYWGGCSVTGCRRIDILKASHIKPWRDSSNQERLDKYNGLLLLPNLDSCFELGLIGFDQSGDILISNKLDKQAREILGITPKMKLKWVDEKHKKFLLFHQKERFQS